jgi:DNA-binding NarL/FixJ family response regulator
MLNPFADRILVVDHDTEGVPAVDADVALFDTFASRRDALERARDMIDSGRVEHVVLYTFDASEEFLELARANGVSGVVLKSASGDVLAAAIERVMAGEKVGLDTPVRASRSPAEGRDLSPREEEVLALLALGLTNAQIGEELFLSVDTVKTYVRRVFTKLGVKNRTQAAMLATERSLTPRNLAAPRIARRERFPAQHDGANGAAGATVLNGDHSDAERAGAIGLEGSSGPARPPG